MPESRRNAHITALFRKYGREVRAYFGQRMRCQEDIEDLTQDTFLKAQQITDWNTVNHPRAYLLQMARNLFLDRLRKEQRNIVSFGDDVLPKTPQSSDRSPEQEAIHQDEYAHLCHAIERLTPKVRKAVVLHKFFHLSHMEVAAAMGISPRTVEKHIAKGVAECLRHMMLVEQNASSGKVISIHHRAANRRRKESE